MDISSGQIERILSEGKERFHQEKALILKVGLEVAEYLTVDVTSARHQGKNGYTTQLGTEHFAWFETTRKLGVSFWEFLIDRLSATNMIPPLPSLIRERAAAH